jgi:hypothetical protein
MFKLRPTPTGMQPQSPNVDLLFLLSKYSNLTIEIYVFTIKVIDI